ncbi:MAG: pitrilysin family protein [Thermoguttaceae bacterium]|nr:pitrilysin family protein [Thermoguttaceae bacterium]
MPETISVHTYPNGLVLVAEPMPWLRSAAFSLLVPAGCALEPGDRGGLASLTSEMVERGCGPRDSRQFLLDLDNLGVEWNDSVSAPHTGFGGAAPAESLPSALAIFADMVRRPHLPAREMEAARSLQLQELRAVEDEPARKVMTELRRRQYHEPWGRPAHGDLAGVEAATLDDVQGFFSRHYRPDGAVLGVAGLFEFARLRDTVAELLSDWEPVESPAPVERPEPRPYLHLPYESAQTQIGIAYASVPYRHPDYFQAWGGVGVLSGGMSSRLFTEVREKRGLCYSVSAAIHTLRDRAGVFCYAGTTADRAQETLEVTLGELRRLAEGVKPDELGRLKARIKSSLIMQQESSAARSGAIAADWYHLGHVRNVAELNALVDQLTCASINEYLAANPPGNFTVVTVGPSPLEVPVAF